jgi:hypothetical protein
VGDIVGDGDDDEADDPERRWRNAGNVDRYDTTIGESKAGSALGTV